MYRWIPVIATLAFYYSCFHIITIKGRVIFVYGLMPTYIYVTFSPLSCISPVFQPRSVNRDVIELGKDLLWILRGVITAVLWSGESGEARPNWQVRALSSVLIKPGFFLRKRLILEAGRRACSSKPADRAAQWRKLSQFQPHTPLPLCLWLQAWQTHECLTPGRVSGFTCALCACQLAGWELLRYYICEWPVYKTCVHVHVCMTSLWSPNPSSSGDSVLAERMKQTEAALCVCGQSIDFM